MEGMTKEQRQLMADLKELRSYEEARVWIFGWDRADLQRLATSYDVLAKTGAKPSCGRMHSAGW
jgi:hypothetical protein